MVTPAWAHGQSGLWCETPLGDKLDECYLPLDRTTVKAAPNDDPSRRTSTAVFPDYLGQAWREFGPNGTLPKQVGIWRNEEHFALGAKLQDTFDAGERRKLGEWLACGAPE